MAVAEAQARLAWRAGFWRLADPKISLASMSAITLGACAAAAARGTLSYGWLGLTLLGIFALEVAKNASGEVFDFDSGTDLAVTDDERSPFSGGKRVLVDGLLTRAQTWTIAAAGYALALVCGLVIVAWREPRVAWLGSAGLALAFFYHAPPWRLSYHGLGELAVALCYGPGIVAGTYLVQMHRVPGPVVALSIPLGLLIAAFLLINEFPDARADAACGKRTLVVRMGRPAAARLFAALLGMALVLTVLLPWMGMSLTTLIALPALFPALGAARIVNGKPDDPSTPTHGTGNTTASDAVPTRRLIPAQAATLRSFILFSALAGVGVLLPEVL
jgi:1,4-dihydroxy-2-naphthoate octaprenyltransferase